MNMLDKSNSFLIAARLECLSEIAEIDKELQIRAQKKEAEENRRLVPEWEKLLKLSHLEGYQTGVTWKYNYVPGGPMIWNPCEAREFHRTDISHEEFNARATLSKTQHGEWMRGFHEGKKHRDDLIRMGRNGN